MLLVEMHNSSNAFIIRLEGRFTGEGAEHVRTLATRFHGEKTLVIDLTEGTFVDAVGEEVLSFLKRLGAEFLADTAYTLDVCERLHLPLARKRLSMKKVSGASDGQEHRAISDSTRPSCIPQQPCVQQE